MESLNKKCNHQSPIIDGRVWHCDFYDPKHDGNHHSAGREWTTKDTANRHVDADIPRWIPIGLIDNSENFSRSTPIDTESEYFRALVKSIADDGFRGSIEVMEVHDSEGKLTGYKTVSGHTRYEAAKHADLPTILCTVVYPESKVEADILTLLENLLRRDPTPADYATAFHILRDRLVTEKGMRAKSAIAYLADRCGISVQRVETLIRIKENLIPELFRAFEGVGGLPLTVTEASCYAGQSQDEQREVYLAWRAVGGRKTPRADPLEDNRPVQPRQSVSRIREAIAIIDVPGTKTVYLATGEHLTAGECLVAKRILQWVLSASTQFPIRNKLHE